MIDVLVVPLIAFLINPKTALIVAVVSLVSVWIGETTTAPIKQRNGARQALTKSRQSNLDFISSWPRIHRGREGDFVVVPDVNIVSHAKDVDLDLSLDVELAGTVGWFLLLANQAIDDLAHILSANQLAEGQLTEPLRIPDNGRVVGYLVFEVFNTPFRLTLT